MIKVDKFYLEINLDDISKEFDKSKEDGNFPKEAVKQSFASPNDGLVVTFLCNGGKLAGKSYNRKVGVFTTLSDINEPYYLYDFAKNLCDKYKGELVAEINKS